MPQPQQSFFFFWFQQFVTMPSHAERQKKYLAKLKGRIGKDEYKEKEPRRHKLKRQEILIRYEKKTESDKNGTKDQKRLVKQLLHLHHTKQPVP